MLNYSNNRNNINVTVYYLEMEEAEMILLLVSLSVCNQDFCIQEEYIDVLSVVMM